MLTIAIVTALAAATPAASSEPDDNVVRCVREEVTGSLTKVRRVCHTVAEWRRIRRDSSAEARRVVQPEGRWSADSIN